jgi:hypothetical protein
VLEGGAGLYDLGRRQGIGGKPGRTWVLGCYTHGDRQQWMEATRSGQQTSRCGEGFVSCLWGFVVLWVGTLNFRARALKGGLSSIAAAGRT